MAKRNMRKKVDFTGPEMVIPNWPMMIATRSVAVTVPRPIPLRVNLPNQWPSPREMKIAIWGYGRSGATSHESIGPPSGGSAVVGERRRRAEPGVAARRGQHFGAVL